LIRSLPLAVLTQNDALIPKGSLLDQGNL